MKNLIWYMFAGTRGGITRAKLVQLLRKNPTNANKIAKMLYLDYKTVRHHLIVLQKNSIIYAIDKDKYGAVYFLTEIFEAHIAIFDEIWKKMGLNLGKP